MNGRSILRRSMGSYLVVLGLGIAGATAASEAAAGCGMYTGPSSLPPSWSPSSMQAHEGRRPPPSATNIVGMWKVSFFADDAAHTQVDFATVQWHSDGTEFMISGGRAPSTGDVCMGAWEQTGGSTYKLKHIALAYSSSDSAPPVVPAAFVGPAIMQQTVTLSRSKNSYAGTFTIDQYAPDETTLIVHITGTVSATRFTAD